MASEIVFVSLDGSNVVWVGSDPQVAHMVADRYPNGVVDAWVLDTRDVSEATIDEWLVGRKIYPIDQHYVGMTVYFEDDVVRGMGVVTKVGEVSTGKAVWLNCEDGDLYDKLSKGPVKGATPVCMHVSELRGEVK